MGNFGDTIRKLREERQLDPLAIAAYLDVEVSIANEIEQGQLTATREQVLKIGSYFNVSEKDLLVAWLSDKLIYEVEDEELGLEALQMAEDKITYRDFKNIDRKKLMSEILIGIKSFPAIQKAWIYGSFSREEDGPKSDIDIAIETKSPFSYFDLAEVQFQLEKKVNRKVDVGFIDSFKPYIFEHVKPDLKLIYERPQ